MTRQSAVARNNSKQLAAVFHSDREKYAMSMPKGKKIARGYATVAEDDGANYRTIADKMTEAGHPMNHTSARNHMLRAMRKFAEMYAERTNMDVTEDQLDEMARSPHFQSAVRELIQEA